MAADVLRPRSCIPGFYPEDAPQYVDTDVKLGDQVLSSGFKSHLGAFYEKANLEDKVRCLELLTSLDISGAAKKQLTPAATHIYTPQPPPPGGGSTRKPQRPHTAMAAMVTAKAGCPPPDPYGPYTTTYDREFWGNTGPGAQADRPASTKTFHASYDLSGPIGNTLYDKEFCTKKVKMAAPLRSGSSSGNRRNNPHPSEGFMNWRLPPRPLPEQPYSAWANQVTDEVMDRVCRGKIRSTYQSDYMGIQQGQRVGQTVKPELDGPLPEDWRSRVPYTLNSNMRHSYQKPHTKKELKGNNSRYGCNKLKSVPAYGVVPTVSSRQMNLKARTTYERDYMEGMRPAGTVDVRHLGRLHAGNAIAARGGFDARRLREMLKQERDCSPVRPAAPTPRCWGPGRRNYRPSPSSSLRTWVGPM